MSEKKKYHYTAVVERTVTDSIRLSVNASGPEEAQSLAEEALSVFPKEVEGDVPYLYIEHRQNDGIEIIDLEEVIHSD